MDQYSHSEVACSSRSPEETRELGRVLSRHVSPGAVICLFGDLGAGKTTFIQGLAEGLGVDEPVTSPSFTLIHEHRGRTLLYHLDLYRLISGDLLEAGVEDVIGSNAVVAVEWAERLPLELRKESLEVEIAFEQTDQCARCFRFRSAGGRGSEILAALAKDIDIDANTRD